MMRETTLTKPKRKTTADYKAFAAQLLTEMNYLEIEMDKDRAESERLKAETQAIKAETDIIKARTAATLSQLMQQVNSLTGTA
jgi:hypothetical protein